VILAPSNSINQGSHSVLEFKDVLEKSWNLKILKKVLEIKKFVIFPGKMLECYVIH